MSESIGVSSAQSRSGITITIKVVKATLKKYGSKIISLAKKIPIFGNSLSSFLEKNLGKLINLLDTIHGGVEEVLVQALMKLGLSRSTAELFADGIITLVSWFI